MHRTIEGVIEVDGTVRLLEPIEGGRVRRVLVTVLDEAPEGMGGELAILAEGALSDWLLDEEEEAWRDLKPAVPVVENIDLGIGDRQPHWHDEFTGSGTFASDDLALDAVRAQDEHVMMQPVRELRGSRKIVLRHRPSQ